MDGLCPAGDGIISPTQRAIQGKIMAEIQAQIIVDFYLFIYFFFTVS